MKVIEEQTVFLVLPAILLGKSVQARKSESTEGTVI